MKKIIFIVFGIILVILLSLLIIFSRKNDNIINDDCYFVYGTAVEGYDAEYLKICKNKDIYLSLKCSDAHAYERVNILLLDADTHIIKEYSHYLNSCEKNDVVELSFNEDNLPSVNSYYIKYEMISRTE